MLLPVGLSYNAHPERFVSVESLVNLQPEFSNGGRQQVILRSCPDLSEFSAGDVDATEGRGIVVVRGIVYAVLGRYLYRIASDGTATQIDRIDGTGIVGMQDNGDLIHITTGAKDYLYNIDTGALTTPSKTAYGYTNAYLNGRFLSEDPDATDQGRFYYSGIDGTTWLDVDFATAEQKTDDCIRVYAFKGTLIPFGTRATEFWGMDGDGPVPVVGAFLNVGIAGRWAVGDADEVVGFLASDGSFRIMQGYNAQRVSTPAVESALGADEDAEVLAYIEQGHTVFQVSTATTTLCYDLTESQRIGKQVWFKRETAASRHKARFCVQAYGKLLTLAYDDGKVYELTRSAIPAVQEFTLPHFANDQERQWSTLDEIELIQRTGTGAAPDAEPQVMMRVSRDNGETWGEERWASEGVDGRYGTRVRWRRMGRFRQITARFRKTDQTEWVIAGVFARGS
jgi:hypothetical protein